MVPGRNPRVGAYYALGSALVLVLATACGPVGVLLLWPAGALAVSATGYFRAGSILLRKRGGCLPGWIRLLMGPVLLGHRLSHAHYASWSDPWNEVTPRVWIGRQLSGAECREAIAAGVTGVLDLTAEFDEPEAFRGLDYRNIPLLDLTAPSPEQLDDAVAFIRRGARNGIVYVHCKVGYSRSAGAVGAYLLETGQAQDVEGVVRILTAVRPRIVIRPEIREALARYRSRLRDGPEGDPASPSGVTGPGGTPREAPGRPPPARG